MRFTSIVLAAVAATGTFAWPTGNPFSNIPGYPVGNGYCLTDAQANFIAETFRMVLANPDRNAARVSANTLIADGYTETSDSINTLAGLPLGGPSFTSKQAFIDGATGGPALPGMSTIKVYHDCNNVLWYWNIKGLAANVAPVKGFDSFTIKSPLSGQINANNLEFNSIAWGRDIGWTCTPPPS